MVLLIVVAWVFVLALIRTGMAEVTRISEQARAACVPSCQEESSATEGNQ